MQKTWKIAVAGNPNSGKTSLFNALTGSRRHVGNYPGVTVERVEGRRTEGEDTLVFVDLPGTYSLTAYSEEERVARRFLVQEKPDVVVDVVDASNIERNLYLTVQLIELGVPLVIAFNMSDVARARDRVRPRKTVAFPRGADRADRRAPGQGRTRAGSRRARRGPGQCRIQAPAYPLRRRTRA